MTRAVAFATLIGLAAGAAAAPAAAEPLGPEDVHPVGAVELSSELLLSGTPRRRAGVAVTAYLTKRVGLRAAARLIQLDPLGDTGLVTFGVAFRAAAARPRLELVVRAEAGVTWPLAPAIGAGTTTYLWPTRFPIALAFDLSAVAIVDGVVDSRVAISVGLGLALAR